MAAKRFLDENDSNSDQYHEKKKKTGTLFASAVREVITGNHLQKICLALEPMIRKAVREEFEQGFSIGTRTLSRSSSVRIQGVEPSHLKLSFSDRLLLPIFTTTKIVDLKRNPLQIILLETRGDHMIQTSLEYPVKVEIVVIYGDFPHGDGETWSSEEFEKNIVKERTGKRPLLIGESHVTMKDGVVPLGEVEFTDNSSWIRSGKFRLGARVVQRSGGIKIQEAISEAFVVKDHRGESYKKHHPPMLGDEVWRLEKIGKGGPFHRKLASEGISTVQEFLKLYILEPSKLRGILGDRMSEKMWKVILKHARNCDLGRKLYVFGEPGYTITLNPICEIVKVVVDGKTYTDEDLSSLITRGYIEDMVKRANANWNSLQEVDIGQLSDTPLLTQGDLVDQYPNNDQTIAPSFQNHALFTGAISLQHNAQAERTGWVETPAFMCTPVEGGVPYNFPDPPSHGDSHQLYHLPVEYDT